MIEKKFFITQDKLHIWKRYCSLMLGLSVLSWFSIISYPCQSKKEYIISFLFVPMFFFFTFILHKVKLGTPVLSFETSCLKIKNKTYRYCDIEQFWVGKGAVMRCGWGSEQFVSVEKMLYIKIKNKHCPFRFDLENNFSDMDSMQILELLKKHYIKNETGDSCPFYYMIQMMLFVFGAFFCFVILGCLLSLFY